MTQPLVVAGADDTIEEAAVLMARYQVGALAVCESNQLIGIATDRDLVRRCLATSRPPATTCVRDVMTRHPIVISPSATLEEAARAIGEHGFRRLPVVDRGGAVGMLSAGNIARFCADAELLAAMERALAT
jgi:CBS domain-containing protein